MCIDKSSGICSHFVLSSNSICHLLITDCYPFPFLTEGPQFIGGQRGSDWFTVHTRARTHAKNTCTCSHCWRGVGMSNSNVPAPLLNSLLPILWVSNWNWDQLLLPQCQCDVTATFVLLLQWQQNISQWETDTNNNSCSQWVKILEITVHRSTGLGT